MAWFRRGAESPSPAEAAPEDDGDLIRQERAPVGDWMTMAPMAPTFGAMPPSFRVQTVAEIMPSHQSPRLSGEMGHSVSASAPSGLVDGLAVSTGAVAATGGHDDLPLREPHHEEPAESPLAALSVRPLAAVTDPEPLPISRLPEPVVSRSLSDAGPAAAPTAPAPALPESLASPEAPLGSDARVGGFGATIDDDGEDLTKGSGDHTELFTPQPDELAPPILPQVRRGGAQELPVMPTIGASPLVGADAGDAIGSAAPPVSKAVGPGAGSLPLARVAEQAGALTPPTPAPVQRHADHAPTPPATASSPTAPAPAAEPDDEAPLLGSSSPSLAANPNETDDGPPVQRRLDTAGPAPTSLEPALGLPLPLVATPPPSPPAPADGPSVSRATDDEVEDGATSPLVGDADLGVPVAPGSPGDDVSGDATSGPGPVASLDLPLVDPAAGGPTSAAQTNDSVAATAGDRAAASGGDSASAPPADSAAAAPGEGSAPLVSVSRLHADTAPLTGTGPAPAPPAPAADAALPLAGRTPPSAPGGSSAPLLSVSRLHAETPPLTGTGPAPAAPAAGAPLPLAGRTPTTAPGESSAPLVSASRLHADTAPLTDSGPAPAAPAASPALPLAGRTPPTAPGESSAPLLSVSRLHAGTAPLTGTGPTPAANAALPLATSSTASTGPGDGGGTSPGAPTTELAPLLSLSRLHAEAAPVAESMPVLAHPAPLLSVSRLPTPTAPAQHNASPSADMTLHSPAAAVPSAAEIVVSAGLAERGPNGTLLYANPPAASPQTEVEASPSDFSVQRAADTAAAPAPVDGGTDQGAGNNGIFVSRLNLGGNPHGGGESQGEGTLQDDAHSLADQARKLYPHIRTQLESDIRRQLEARNRAGRYRP